MRNELTQLEHIEQYLEGKLGREENNAFEQSLRADESLREAVELQKAIMERVETISLRKIIKEVHVSKGGKGWSPGLVFGITVIGLVIVYAAWSYFGKEEQTAPAKVARTEIKPIAPAIPKPVIVQKEKPAAPVAQASAPARKNVKSDNTRSFAPEVASKPEAGVKKDPAKVETKAQESEKAEPWIVYNELQNEDFLVPYSIVTFNAEAGGKFTDSTSGSSVTVPAGILVYADGRPVKGEVDLYFREFRDAADMAYCGIPMTYQHNNSSYNFNSAGMFEIHAMKGGDTLHIRPGKAVGVDLVLTQDIPGLAFYGLDEEENEWNELGKIQTDSVKVAVNANKTPRLQVTVEGTPISMDKEKNDAVWVEEVSKDGTIRKSSVKPADPQVFVAQKAGKNAKSASLLASGMDGGHTYPTIVKGLLCSTFGVYNCDQMYRMGTVVRVGPTFKDAAGNIISQQSVLTVIDLNYNGSFSFDPRYSFSMNPKDKNVLLLFTKDKKVFSFNDEKFKEMNIVKSGNIEFEMTEITEQVKSTNDLRKYLGLAKN